MQLTGPPKLNDYTAPYCSSQTPLQAAFRDESVTVQGRQGTIFTREQRVRGRFTLEWRGLSYETAARILYEIRDGEVTLTPRTAVPGEGLSFAAASGVQVALEEVTLPCRVVGRYPTSTPLNAYVGQQGDRVATLRIELETKQTYQGVPGFGTPATFTYRVSASSGDPVEAKVSGPIRDQLISWTIQDVLSGSTIATIQDTDLAYSDWLSDERTYRVTAAFSQDDLSGLERIHSFARGKDDWGTSDTDYDAIPDSCVISTLSDTHPRTSCMTITVDTSNVSTGNHTALPFAKGVDYDIEVQWQPNDSPLDVTRYDQVAPSFTAGGVTFETFSPLIKEYNFEYRGEVKVAGSMPRWAYANQPDSIGSSPVSCKSTLIAVNEWADVEWVDFSQAFYGCSELLTTGTAVSYDEQAGTWVAGNTLIAGYRPAPEVLLSCFRECASLAPSDVEFDFAEWDVSSVQNASALFQAATSFDQDLSALEWLSIEFMIAMFRQASDFNNAGQPLGWTLRASGDVSITMINMFKEATAFNAVVESWDMTRVQSIRGIFDRAGSFNQPLAGWDTSSIEDFSRMFVSGGGISVPFDQDLGPDFVAASARNTSEMFKTAAFNNGGSDSIRSWDMSNVTNINQMFSGSFNQPINDWDVSAVTNMSNVFGSAFDQFIGDWDVSNVVNMHSLFSFDYNQDISGWTPISLESASNMFGENSIFDQDISGWDLSSLRNGDRMFFNASSFNGQIGNAPLTLERARLMFQNASAFDQDISGWDVSQVDNFDEGGGLFANGAGFAGATVNTIMNAWEVDLITAPQTDRISWPAAADGAIDQAVLDNLAAEGIEVYAGGVLQN